MQGKNYKMGRSAGHPLYVFYKLSFNLQPWGFWLSGHIAIMIIQINPTKARKVFVALQVSHFSLCKLKFRTHDATPSCGQQNMVVTKNANTATGQSRPQGVLAVDHVSLQDTTSFRDNKAQRRITEQGSIGLGTRSNLLMHTYQQMRRIVSTLNTVPVSAQIFQHIHTGTPSAEAFAGQRQLSKRVRIREKDEKEINNPAKKASRTRQQRKAQDSAQAKIHLHVAVNKSARATTNKYTEAVAPVRR